MKFLPIVERELRVAARRWGTFWLRTWVGMTVIAVSAWIVLANLDDPPAAVAGYLFHTVTSGALLYCLLIGVRATADCLSEEKREGTLGLLFLTDLKGYDVVAGKLVANSLNCFYGLLAIIPVMGLPLLMGGITGEQFGCAAIALVNALFLSVCVGMFASACCQSERKAMVLTLAIVLVVTIGIPGYLLWHRTGGPILRLDSLPFLCSPIVSFIAPNDIPGLWVKDLRIFVQSVGVVHAEAWIFLLLACLIVPHSWQDRPAGAKRMRWRERWQLWGYGDVIERKSFRSRLLDVNAYFWLAARARLKPLWVWAMFGLVALVWVWGYGEHKRDWFHEAIYVATAFTVNSILKNWLAGEAVRQLSEDRRAGSLELLLATSLTTQEILRGQALALRRQFFWPVLVALSAELLMMLAGMRSAYDSSDRTVWVAWWTAGLIIFIADLVALYWVGMWMGLASRSPKRAFSDTVGRVLALPWVVFTVFLLFVALITVRGRADVGWKVFLGFWFAVGLAVDIGFGMWAAAKLRTEFREAATWRFERRVSWWKRLLGKND